MENLRFYIIFHKKLYPQNTPSQSCIRYLAANELIRKEIDISSLKHAIETEYDIPGYNPMYQILNFCDNSIILNVPAPPTPYIGFAQYDMKIDEAKFQLVIDTLGKSNGKSVVGFYPYPMGVIMDVLQESDWSDILGEYNKANKTEHTISALSKYPYLLMNAYILPSWYYTRHQQNLKRLLPSIIKKLNYSMRHIAGTLERTNALLIACGMEERLFDVIVSDAMTDDRTQTERDVLRH